MRYTPSNTAIIISTRNRPELLRDTLLRFADLAVVPRQIIVVSSSESRYRNQEKHVITQIQKVLAGLQYAVVRHINKAHNLNAAVRLLKRSVSLVAFTDDDCLVPRSWIADMIRYHARYPSVGIITGSCTSHQNDYLVRAYVQILTPPGKNPVNFPYALGGNMSVKRFSLPNQLCFDERFRYCEDYEFAQRWRASDVDTVLAPRLTVITTYPAALWAFLTRSFRHGQYEYAVNEMYGTPLKDLYTPGRRHPILKSVFNIFPLFCSLTAQYAKEKRDAALFFGYMLFETAKVTGMFVALLSHHLFGISPIYRSSSRKR